jgi:hypothetical protein
MMSDKPLIHWSDGDGAYPTETWCGIPFYIPRKDLVTGQDWVDEEYVENPVLGGGLGIVMSDDCAFKEGEGPATYVTCPKCLALLVERELAYGE